MKDILRKLFSFILKNFEKGNEPYSYKPLNRKILVFIGAVFFTLGSITTYMALSQQNYGYVLPSLVMLSVGTVCLVVGLLGNERAVAKIWGSR